MLGIPPTEVGPVVATLPPPAPFPVITAFGPYGGVQGNAVATTSTFWPTANTAFYLPILVPTTITVRNLFVYNGGLVSGNLDLGLYDCDGVRLVALGSTAQTGTNVLQIIAITPLLIPAGQYYLALVLDNTSGIVYSTAGRRSGARMEASAFPLPAVASLGPETGQDLCWWCGLTTREFL